MVSEAARQASLILYCWTAPRLEPTLQFLRHRARGIFDDAAAGAEIEEWYLAADISTISAVTAPTSAAGKKNLETARKWLADCDLHKWVGDANRNKGIAPVSEHIVRKRNQLRDDGCAAADAKFSGVRGTAKRLSALKWIYRWRRRWGLRRGTLATESK